MICLHCNYPNYKLSIPYNRYPLDTLISILPQPGIIEPHILYGIRFNFQSPGYMHFRLFWKTYLFHLSILG